MSLDVHVAMDSLCIDMKDFENQTSMPSNQDSLDEEVIDNEDNFYD